MKQILIIMLITFSFTLTAQAVKVDKNGDFVQISSQRAKQDTVFTNNYYIDRKGGKHPVYQTDKGKYFVPTISKNGKYYRRYLKVES